MRPTRGSHLRATSSAEQMQWPTPTLSPNEGSKRRLGQHCSSVLIIRWSVAGASGTQPVYLQYVSTIHGSTYARTCESIVITYAIVGHER